MRKVFDTSKLKINSWYPRHMNAGMHQVKGKLHSVDYIIHVHDARIPFTGRNSNLSDMSLARPSCLVFNKIDLISPHHLDTIKKRVYDESGEDVTFNNCKVSGHQGVKTLMPRIIQGIQNSDRYNRSSRKEYHLMVMGIPNVGKSSLINALRNHYTKSKNAAVVGARPGVTRAVLTKIRVSFS